MRLLIVSTLDSDEPFGAYTRPFYLGMYLAQRFEVCQLGLNCSSVDYAKSVSVGSRGLGSYVKAIRQQIEDFQPDVVYAQETLPGVAALIACGFGWRKRPALFFDFHTLSANEYWTRLATSKHRFLELKQFVKTYLAQGMLARSGKTIVAAGSPVVKGIKSWYGVEGDRVCSIRNGVPDDLIATAETVDPYQALRPAKVVVVVAPKTFQFPTNDMSVEMTVEVAKLLEADSENIHFVVIGRTAEDVQGELPKNISFTGFLPSREDFVEHLRCADVGLLPFSKEAIAGGARNKALDYLACGILVVSTPEGMRGLDDFGDRQHLLVAGESSQSVAETIKDACNHLENYKPLADSATRLVEESYSWRAVADELADVFVSKLRVNGT